MNNSENKESIESLLKVENLDKNEYLVTATVVEPPVEKTEQKSKKVSLFGALFAAISIRKSDELYTAVRPIRTISFFVLILVFSVLLYFFYEIADVKLVLGLIVIFAALAFPLLLLTFFYELCPIKMISLFHIMLSFVFGAFLYLGINALTNGFLIKNIYKSTIDTVVVPILWGIGELIFIAVLSKMYNISDLSTEIALAVSVGMGYAAIWALHGLIDSLFIPVEVIIGTGAEHYVGSAIVDNQAYTSLSIKAALPQLVWRCLYYPVCVCCWSVVVGNVLATPDSRLNEKSDKPFSVYLLLVLVIALYMLSMFTTSFTYFDSILKIVSFFSSLFVAIRITNNALSYSLGIRKK